MADFLKWNAGVNSGCTNLELGNYMCVGVITTSEPTPTKTTGGVVTPTPTQEASYPDANTVVKTLLYIN
ncbi:hypothetical protein CDV31_002431 [Fusarium ambrosium]|uniref:LysM domain-containing protein n=1 Tax=Fusarium ambrosium TaxID=131363 RepID=A0A428UWN4_9HYPO|nr:hypothetical protein CDV31_002431 [Fusarium ambrosium]